MSEYLSEQDLKEGKELMEILERLSETCIKQVIIYAGALADRQLIEDSEKRRDIC